MERKTEREPGPGLGPGTSTSYMGRLIARRGAPHAHLLGPPEAPAPLPFDLLSEEEDAGELNPPPANVVRPAESGAPAAPVQERKKSKDRKESKEPKERSASATPQAGETTTIIERIEYTDGIRPAGPRAAAAPVEPEAGEAPVPRLQPGLLPVAKQWSEAPPAEGETVARAVHRGDEPGEEDAPPPRSPDVWMESPVVPARREIHERVFEKYSEPPGPKSQPAPLEPAAEPDAPAFTPVPENGAPRISIGEIVVEVMTKPEKPQRAPAAVAARSVRAPSPVVPRAGVRSKRGFGLGQM